MPNDRLSSAFATVSQAVGAVEPDQFDRACDLIASAATIGVYGCGREGYQMRGFAMRLFHLGLQVGYVGDTTMPPLGDGDLLVVSAGPGNLATVDAHIKTARKAGAQTLLITAQPPIAPAADHLIIVPAKTMAGDEGDEQASILPMGSVYEGALFFLFELMVDDLKQRLGETAETMRVRHTNME